MNTNLLHNAKQNLSNPKTMLGLFCAFFMMSVLNGCATYSHLNQQNMFRHLGEESHRTDGYTSRVQTTNLDISKNRVAKSSVSEAEIEQYRISGRLQDTKTSSALDNLSYQKAVSMFQEASNMIDQRHIDPATYAERSSNGLRQIAIALGNNDFMKKAGVKGDIATIATVQKKLNAVADNFKVNNLNESTQLLNYAASYLQQTLGVSPSITAYEFTVGIVESLDKYSSLGLGENFTDKSVDAGDNLIGIGAELKAEERGARIMRPLQNSPAEKAGLMRGDLIVAVNGQALIGLTLNQIVPMIKGPLGSVVKLQIERGDKTYNASITRGEIIQQSVSEIRMINNDNKVGYIRVDKFASDSTELVRKGLWELHNQGMESLILDLRGNPGGLLTTAISMSDLFLPNGVIVSTKGRTQNDNSQDSATFSQTWKTPLIVLVDGNSASASEIFAAAIQENKRGLVVGEKSYGKGTVQTHFPLRTVTGNLKLTTAKFYSPTGREMAGAGVTPDLLVTMTAKNPEFVWSQDIVLEKALEATTLKSSEALLADWGKPGNVGNRS